SLRISMRGFTDETAPHQIAFEAYGVRVRLCASSPELLPHLEQLLPPGSSPSTSPDKGQRLGIVEQDDGTYTVFNGAAPINDRGGLALALVVLDGQVRSWV